MPGGRPTKYTKKFLETAKDYLENFEDYGDVIPSIAGLAVVSSLARETLRAWSHEEDKAEFSVILANILSKQERVLVNKGLSGDFNSAITKLVLGKHDYHDKADNVNTHQGPNGEPLTAVEIVTVSAKKKAKI